MWIWGDDGIDQPRREGPPDSWEVVIACLAFAAFLLSAMPAFDDASNWPAPATPEQREALTDR